MTLESKRDSVPRDIPDLLADCIRHHQAGRYAEAVVACRAALCLKPDHAQAHCKLGDLFHAVGRFEDAATAYGAALRMRPDFAAAHLDMGNTLKDLGRCDDAIVACRKALSIRPDFAAAYSNLGNILKDLARADESVVAYAAALRLKPDFADAHANMGSALKEMGHPLDANRAHVAALCCKPDHAAAHYNRGNAFCDLGRLDAAAAAFGAALWVKPDYAEAYNNMGNVLKGLGRHNEAIAAYGAALRLKPDYPEAHHNLGLALLSVGRFEGGWRECEWRWQRPDFATARRNFLEPRWQGEDLAGQSILLYAEQGMGDAIQFCRYAPLVAAKGGRVILEVPRALLGLFHRLPGVETLLAAGEPLPNFEVQCPLMSVPGLCGTRLDNIPPALPFAIDTERAANWKNRLHSANRRVGIVWQGNPKHKGDRERSVPLASYAALAAVPGVDIISLQKGFGVDQIDHCPETLRLSILGPDYDAGDFSQTASVLSALDLVITVDSAVAHLAGTMDVPTWVALPFNPDWRWLLDRDDTPWYPTMRLFRQTSRGDWQGVFERMALELRSMTPRSVPP